MQSSALSDGTNLLHYGSPESVAAHLSMAMTEPHHRQSDVVRPARGGRGDGSSIAVMKLNAATGPTPGICMNRRHSKSIYDELVPLFQAAKSRRQVILVTHNANLVVNTDADQIIVARVGAHPGNGLPPITYHSGGLDEQSIRRIVCDILEGGDLAFRDRARRLRIALER